MMVCFLRSFGHALSVHGWVVDQFFPESGTQWLGPHGMAGIAATGVSSRRKVALIYVLKASGMSGASQRGQFSLFDISAVRRRLPSTMLSSLIDYKE
jgi:hypothetical protein